MGGTKQQVCNEGGVLDGNTTGFDSKGKEVPEVIVDCNVGAKDYWEELCTEHIFNGLKKGSNVRDDAADVLPFCHEAANKPSVGRMRESGGHRGKGMDAVRSCIDLGVHPTIAGGSRANEATNISLALAELHQEQGILEDFTCRGLRCIGVDSPAFGQSGEASNAGSFLAEGNEESSDA